MHRDHDGSLKSWLLEALAAFCPLNVARVFAAWTEGRPVPIRIETRDTRRRRPRD